MLDCYKFKLTLFYISSVSILIACCLAVCASSSEEFEGSGEESCTIFDLAGLIIDGRVSDECYGLTELPNGGFAIKKDSNITLKAKEFLPDLPNNFKVSFVMYLRKYYKQLVTFLSIVDDCNNFIVNINYNPSNQYLTIQIKNYNERAYQVSYHISMVSLIANYYLIIAYKHFNFSSYEN